MNTNAINGPFGLNYFSENSNNAIRQRKFIVESGLSPFDDIYADSANTRHIRFEGLESLVEKIKEREFMFKSMYLQNRRFANTMIRQFYADSIIAIGRDVNINIWPDKEIEGGNVVVYTGANLTITAGETIRLMPGVKINNGSAVHMFIEPDSLLSRPGFAKIDANYSGKVYKRIVPFPILTKRITNSRVDFSLVNRFDSAKNEDYKWTLRGVGVELTSTGYDFAIKNLQKGQYSITCDLFNGQRIVSEVFSILESENHINDRFVHAYSNQKNGNLYVSPNPISNHININYVLTVDSYSSFEIIDIYGRTVLSTMPIYNNAGRHEENFNLEKIENGLYFLVLKLGSTSQVSKIIVNK